MEGRFPQRKSLPRTTANSTVNNSAHFFVTCMSKDQRVRYGYTWCVGGHRRCSWYSDSLWARLPKGSKSGEGKRFNIPIRAGPNAHPAPLYNGYQGFPGVVKRPGSGTGHPPSSSSEAQYTAVPASPTGARLTRKEGASVRDRIHLAQERGTAGDFCAVS